MTEERRFGAADLLLLVLVVAAAAGARAGYLWSCADSGRTGGPLLVQDRPAELDVLVRNLKEHGRFAGPAPFAAGEEVTAHVAPGYPYLLSGLARLVDPAALDSTVRWVQCGLGALTAGLYFLFARRVFGNLTVATLAGLFGAFHPFWVIDTAAVADGTLAGFLLALALLLGVRAVQTSGPFASLLFGLTLAGLALVRAALLPFAFVAVAWFLFRSRGLARGWLCALLAFLGFANGLAPWMVRNFQLFREPVPVVDSAYLHLWVGNNPHADGGPLTDRMRESAPTAELERTPNQTERYARLGALVRQEVRDHPAETLRRRLQAGFAFLCSARWFQDGQLAEHAVPGETTMPDWLARGYPVTLQAVLLALLLLGLLGWRWTYGWRFDSMPATLALVWVPLPYLLSHAEALSGPRLPLDGVLLCYAAFALTCLVPGQGRDLLAGPPRPVSG
jgi:4-amino-4-deoxy-L-arabinose transferase-like glycosyltransferase